MGTSFSSVVNYLKGTRDAWTPGTTRFPEIDVDQLARDLDLERRAREVATAGLDHALPDGQDALEREIAEEIRARARIAQADFNSAMDVYEARLRDASVGDEAFVRIKACAEEGLANFHAQSVEDRLPLDAVDDDLRRVNRQFHGFVRANRLTDIAPVLLTRREKVGGWFWIASIVLIESIANGLFFAQGSEAGLIGGIGEALFLSFLNVALAGVLGLFALRYLRHVRWSWKLLAFATMLATVAAVIALNLLIAHYREAFSVSAGQGVDFRSVLASLRTDPWSLADARSWLLGFIGIALNVVAIYKFQGLQDPYPGFGRISERRKVATAFVVAARIDCIDSLTNHRDEAIDGMNRVIDALSAKKRDFELAVRSRDRLNGEFHFHLQSLEAACARLGQIYRQHLPRELAASRREPLEAGLESPEALPAAFTGDAGAHDRAIATMSEYIERISRDYREAVEQVGAETHRLESNDAEA